MAATKTYTAQLAALALLSCCLEEDAVTPLPLPAGVLEWLSPLVAIVPSQLLALHLTRVKGHDPDQPQGLQKVTRTH